MTASELLDTAVYVQAIKAYSGSRGTAQSILNLATICRCVVNIAPWLLYPWERIPVPTE